MANLVTKLTTGETVDVSEEVPMNTKTQLRKPPGVPGAPKQNSNPLP